MSGELTEEDEQAVDEELAAILSEQLPDVPGLNPEFETENDEKLSPQKGNTSTRKGTFLCFYSFIKMIR